MEQADKTLADPKFQMGDCKFINKDEHLKKKKIGMGQRKAVINIHLTNR